MDLTVPQWATYAVAWFGLIAGVWALFERAETVINDDTRRSIAAWLKGLPAPDARSWTIDFCEVFKRIFGERHWSWRCFAMSALLSTIFLLLVNLLWSADDLTDPDYLGVLVWGAFFNLIPDYFALLKTRIVLRRMTSVRSAWRTCVLLLVDVIVGVLIFSVAITVFNLWRMYPVFDIPALLLWAPFLFATAVEETILSATHNPIGGADFGLFFYATFMASLWIWLYVVSGLTGRMLLTYGAGVTLVKRVLDIDQKPLRSIGFVAMMIVTIGFLLVPFGRWVF